MNGEKRTKSSVGKFLILAMAMVEVFLLTQWLQLSQNSLFQNDRWIVGKRMMEMVLIGADEFFLKRYTLRGEGLNLGEEYGLQKILSREVFTPSEIRFDFLLTSQTFLNFLLGESEKGFLSVRFSAHDNAPSGLIEVTPEGEFRKITPFDILRKVNLWSRARINVSGSEISISINEREVYRGTHRHEMSGRIGFWGGINPVRIKNIEIRNKDGQRFEETFVNTKYWQRYAALATLIVALFLILISACSYFQGLRIGATGKSYLYPQLMGLISMFVLTGILFCFDRLYWSQIHFYVSSQKINGEPLNQLPLKFELSRVFLFDFLSEIAGVQPPTQRVIERKGYPAKRIWRGPIFCSDKITERKSNCSLLSEDEFNRISSLPKKGLRILLSGSSQTIGAGASRLEKTFFARMDGELRRRFKNKKNLESVNIAISGDVVLNQFYEYQNIYLKFKPDLVILNWSFNDNSDLFEENLSKFLELNRKKKIKTLLSLEAHIGEPELELVEKNHRTMEQLARRYKVPLFNLHGYLVKKAKYLDSFSWWDSVHLTDLGHRRAAEGLTPVVNSILNSSKNN